MVEDVDFVITYIDGNDTEWQKEKCKYLSGSLADNHPNRYRNWNNIQYLFRGIEAFAPWVRNVYFITYGHLPKWLNDKHPKLCIIRHEDYIPQEWLPTFNSHCIELNFFRIPGLSEQFVYFNDDTFITKNVQPKDFFIKGKPCDSAVLFVHRLTLLNGIVSFLPPLMSTAVINKYFDTRHVITQNPFNWFNLKYGKYNLWTLSLLAYKKFPGFYPFHLPSSYLKSTFETVWENETQLCTQTSMHKFRECVDISPWVMNYWQFATGNFVPRNVSFGKCFHLDSLKMCKIAANAVRRQKYKTVCLNDTVENEQDFPSISEEINDALQSILPQKSEFEK